MAELPSGTVTFLFTDIEGSTRRWEEHPDVMPGALARHDAILGAAITGHDGVVFSRMGDGMAAAFASARDAVAAALDAQRGFAAESWPETVAPIRARMGIHTGEGVLVDSQYLNQPLNRCARLMAIAHGGQLVISGTTEPLVRNSGLPNNAEMIDLGEHRLRDLSDPLHVFQVHVAGLEHRFPPLRSLNALLGNLPVQVTSFVGRDRELDTLATMVDGSRLITLTGVGGIGKTRLALQVTAEVAPRFADGVWFCELAAASDEALMFQAVADAVGARQRDGMSLADSIVEYLRDRTVLVVLDNCEHVLPEASWLASALLQHCPSARVLATSREGLGVPGEQIVAVSSLALPGAAADATTSDAVRLFIDRAVAVRPGFVLDASNSAAVSEICRRVDGVPLAIELAATRVTAMTASEIASRLDERFRLLTGGRRGRVERHQTLRATVEWSYSLLEPTERPVFDRLGVFVGSFDAAAAEAVVADDKVGSWDVLDCLVGLVGKSMVLAEPTDQGTTRYRLLETLRAFARERLDAADETDHWRRRHATYYCGLCERARPQLDGPEEQLAIRRVDADIDNVRSVLSWGVDAPAQDDADLAIRILVSLGIAVFRPEWGLIPWASALLPRARTSSMVESTALMAGVSLGLINHHDDPDACERLVREVLDIPGARTFAPTIASCYNALATVRYRQGRTAEALELLAESRAALEAVGAPDAWHHDRHSLGSMFHATTGDMEASRVEAETTLAIARAVGKPSMLAQALMTAGWAWFGPDPAAALAAFEESIDLGGLNLLAVDGAAQLRARLGDRRGALAYLRKAIATDHDTGSRTGIGLRLERAIATLASLQEDELAATVAGVVQSDTVTAFRTLPQSDRAAARVADRMGADAYSAAFDRGAGLSYLEVAPLLLAELDRLLNADAIGGDAGD
jgi:predicted ATPase/class 3 adenylate cyclase/tetratricopeptide (TPR) repeat protein